MDNNLTEEYYLKNVILNLKRIKFKTGLKNYESLNISIKDNQNFKIIFKNLYEFVINFQELVFDKIDSDNLKSSFISYFNCKDHDFINSSQIDEFINGIIISNLSVIEQEILLHFPSEWLLLNNKYDKTKIHIIYSLIYVANDIKLNKEFISDYDENILLWSILLHDISKHVIIKPELKEDFSEKCRDKLHPFKSGATALKIFYNNNLIQPNYKDTVEMIYKKLIDSHQLVYYERKQTKQLLQSHLYLNDIHSLINELNKDDQWIIDIITLIIFHQSLPNASEHMNQPLLNEYEINLFFNKRLLELMRIIMINDSASHSKFKNKSFSDEINENLDKINLKL